MFEQLSLFSKILFNKSLDDNKPLNKFNSNVPLYDIFFK